MDKLLVWNYTEKTVFAKMKKDIVKPELDGLVRSHQKLQERIDKQPEGERSYDIDVSFSTPLL